MQKILHTGLALTALTALTISTTAAATVVFDEDFDGQTISHKDSATITFGANSSDVSVEQWFSASNGIAINNELQLTNFAVEKSRGAGIWLDTSAWITGTYTVEFDVLDYAAGGTNSESFFQAYYATGVSASSTVSFDLHGGGGQDPATAAQVGATIGTVGDRNTITANATDAQFTFDYTAGQDIALIFHNMSGTTGAMPVYSIDNLTVAVPEPSSAALIGLGGLALLLRRSR